MFKPRLLRETAEIALTEIKRYVETHLTDDFSLRRVSAPLYLPVASKLNDPGETVRFHLPGQDEELEIVRGLDNWLRSQLLRYDIAPGFGVFTVMNAIRPEVRETSTQSPHLTAWAWQQVVAPESANNETMVEISRKLYQMLISAEEMIIAKLPHLSPTLPSRLHTIKSSHLEEKYPNVAPSRREYQYLHDNPSRAILLLSAPADCHSLAPSGHEQSATDQRVQSATDRRDNIMVPKGYFRIVVWNPNVKCPLCIAELTLTASTIGGNILRDPLAMQILHQPHLLR